MHRLRCLLVVAAAAAAAPAQDGGRVRGDSTQTRTRLAETEQKLLGGKPAEAADDLLKLLDDAGDDLVSTDGVTYRPARWVAQTLLAKLPPDVLRTVRGRIDGPAARLLDQGKAARDRRPLRLLLDRYFVARPAEDALLLLGDLLFERGEFRAAAAAWRKLLPDAPADEPAFPDPTADPAAVRAKLALALVFAGDLDQAQAELATLRNKHPKAAGPLAGRTGPYLDTLMPMLAAPPRVPPDATPGGDWTTFAGSAARTGAATDRLSRYWSPSPTWRTPIPPAGGPPPGRTRPFASASRACTFHAVVLGGTAYITDPVRVIGFDLRTGRSSVGFDLSDQFDGLDLALPPAGSADYTLTAAEGRLYARLGRPEIPPPADPAAKPGPASLLVGLAPNATGTLAHLWSLPPPAGAEGVVATWEAAPVVANGRIYAAVARVEGTRVVHSVAAYADPPGRPLWVTDVAESPTATTRTRPEPLTLAGDVLVFCSHSGVVATVDAFTGRPAWAHRYRPGTPPGPNRDLCPAVAADGRVFAAPADAGAVFALDAGTGKPLWDVDGLAVDQLIGVSRGRLVAALDKPVKGVRGFHLATGATTPPHGWRTHDDPKLGSFGRGLVSEELILWPTQGQAGTYLLHAADGTNAAGWQTLREARGNLAYADGVLVAATPTEVMGFVADRDELDDRRKAVAARPGDGHAVAELALALGDAGRWDEANAAWATTGEAARRIGENLTDRAERAADRGHAAEAAALFRASLAAPIPDALRVRAAARVAVLDPGGKVPPRLADGWVLASNGRPVRLREYVADPAAAATDRVPAGVSLPVRRPPTDWTPSAATPIAPPVRVAKRVFFPTPQCVPLKPFAGETGLPGLGAGTAEANRHLIVTDGRAVYGYRPGAERPSWLAELPAGLSVSHAAADGDRLILTGPRGVVPVRLADGVLGRAVLIPDTDPLPATGGFVTPRWSGPPPPAAELSGFVLAGSRLVARLGDHHLVGIDPTAGRVAWLLDGTGRPRFTPYPFATAPGFTPHLGTDGRYVVAQLTTGKRVAVSGDSGRMSDPVPTALVPWSAPPALAPDGGLVVADGPGTLRLLNDPGTGSVGWTFDAEAEASWTGRPPVARWLNGSVLTIAYRNYGVEVNRLRADRAVLWQPRGRSGGPVLLPEPDLEPWAADADEEYVYLPAGGRLTAVVWRTGRPAWAADLAGLVGPGAEGTAWAVRAGRRAVFAYPTAAVPFDPPADVAVRAAARFLGAPLAGRLPAAAAGVYDAWASRSVPVLVFDPATGEALQRLDLPAAGPAVGVHLGPDAAVVATAGAVYWLE